MGPLNPERPLLSQAQHQALLASLSPLLMAQERAGPLLMGSGEGLKN